MKVISAKSRRCPSPFCCPIFLTVFQKIKNIYRVQWRIQDFPKMGAPTLGGTNIRFCQIFPKTAWNWKNLDPQEACFPSAFLRSTIGVSAPTPAHLVGLALILQQILDPSMDRSKRGRRPCVFFQCFRKPPWHKKQNNWVHRASYIFGATSMSETHNPGFWPLDWVDMCVDYWLVRCMRLIDWFAGVRLSWMAVTWYWTVIEPDVCIPIYKCQLNTILPPRVIF